MTKLALALLAAGAALGAQATPQVSGPGACGIRAVDNESFLSCDGDEPVLARPAAAAAVQAIAPRDAWRLRHDTGARSLIVDIRGLPEVIRGGMPLGTDANVPYVRSPGTFDPVSLESSRLHFNPRFAWDVDAVLRASGMTHDDPVVLLCRSGTLSRMAAELLAEHGYAQVFHVTGGYEGAAANRDGFPAGWKRAGLPWSPKVQSGWLKVAR